MFEQGYVQIFTGDGRGKTSAALGTSLRVLGNGGKVFFAQFIKGREVSSEFHALAAFGTHFEHHMFGKGRFIKGKPDGDDLAFAEKGLRKCALALSSGDYNLVVMDELNGAVSCGLLNVKDVLEMIKLRNSRTELVITGRGAHPELVAVADLVSDIVPVKHYYEKGVKARRGIEF